MDAKNREDALRGSSNLCSRNEAGRDEGTPFGRKHAFSQEF